jgi:hypothetical protein
MRFCDRLIIFAGIFVGAIENRKRLLVSLSVIREGYRECFGKERWL